MATNRPPIAAECGDGSIGGIEMNQWLGFLKIPDDDFSVATGSREMVGIKKFGPHHIVITSYSIHYTKLYELSFHKPHTT